MYVRHVSLDRIYQGDILRDLTLLSWDYVDGEYDIRTLKLLYAVVMTQDCDLSRDYENRHDIKEIELNNHSSCEQENKTEKNKEIKHDKYLPTILVCPAYPAELLKEGSHLKGLGQTMERWGKDKYKDMKSQNNLRFHYLEGNQNMQVAELIIDFKHYYTVPRDFLYKIYNDKYLTSLNQLYREHLSHRFVYYLSRIGLPDFVHM